MRLLSLPLELLLLLPQPLILSLHSLQAFLLPPPLLLHLRAHGLLYLALRLPQHHLLLRTALRR